MKKSNLFLFLFSFSTLLAQNFNDALRLGEPGIYGNARTLGMGNAFIGLANDVNSMLFNPAGLAQLKKLEFSTSLNYNSLGNNSEFFNTYLENSNSSTSLNQFSFAYPVPTYRGSLVFGFGYNKMKDFNYATKFAAFNPGNTSMIKERSLSNDNLIYDLYLSYELLTNSGNYIKDTTLIGGRLLEEGRNLQEGSLDAWTISLASEISRNLFAGISLNAYSGTYKSNREFSETDTRDYYTSAMLIIPGDNDTRNFRYFYMNDIVDWDVTGWDIKLGLLYRFNRDGSIGISIKLPSYFTVKEKYYLTGEAAFEDILFSNNPSQSSDYEYDITTPFEIAGGFSYQIVGLRINADFKYSDLTQMSFSDGFDQGYRESVNTEIKDLLTGIFSYNAGLEYLIPMTPLRMRAGFMSIPSSFKGDPSTYTRNFVTGGLGIFATPEVSIDAAYAYGWWKNFSDNYGQDVSVVNHDLSSHNFMLSVGYRF
ncbi:MAG: hypothetical protein K9I71_00440 [Ignavibacteriales bacterium]|nr:hypothetical protein [Ignavibacteriales bacterium]MCF8314556.1 hypothetical protein [Ignavibacteriales bacterium]MCF8436407.1 hypothetical protein [Ignavibacteriales bacterium]